MRKPRLKYVYEYQDRHGKWRARFRRNGLQYSFKHPAGSHEFFQEYEALIKNESPQASLSQSAKGTLSELITAYYQGPLWTILSEDTKVSYKRQIEKFRSQYGSIEVNTACPKRKEFISRAAPDLAKQWNSKADENSVKVIEIEREKISA